MVLLALLLLRPPDAQTAMKAYWDKLERAKSLHVVIKVSGPTNDSYEVWMQKPRRMRITSGDAEVRLDGTKAWIINRVTKTYHSAPTADDDFPNSLEPFFGIHHFDHPQIVGGTLILKRKDKLASDQSVFVDLKTLLPTGDSHTNGIDTYTGRCIGLELDSKKVDFSWPPLKGYTEIKV